MNPLLTADDLFIAGRLEISRLTVKPPSMVALIGPNGSGKTSLLRALAGVEQNAGSVMIEGEALQAAPPARRARLLGFLPASRDLVWPISGRDVIRLGPVPPGEREVEELIAALELESLVDRPISSLSTGERSRVLLARVVSARPRLLLLDEPLANLDPYWVIRTLELIRGAVADHGSAVIVSLHSLSNCEAFDRVILIDGGRIESDGKPGDVLTGDALRRSFRVQMEGRGWRVTPPADRRSSP